MFYALCFVDSSHPRLTNVTIHNGSNYFVKHMPIKHLYIHIPFCHRRCAYCDFNTYANMEDRMEAYVDALCGELMMLKQDARRKTKDESLSTRILPTADCRLPTGLTRSALRPTIFLGGGTPSMLPLDLMERVLVAADAVVSLDAAEVTVEANPGTVLGRDYLRGLRAMGVNRLSMGVQSLHDPTLRVLGRIHTAAEAYTSFEDARRAGFDNINLDFIFGLPHQTEQQWEQTLDTIVDWGTEHFSLYSLILEPTTPLYAQVTAGRVSVPDDDATATMYEAAMERFAAAGYVQYEISNWARGEKPRKQKAESRRQKVADNEHHSSLITPILACHHNLAYWLNANYLAAGAGAHGHVYPQRYADILSIDDYIGAVRAGRRPIAEVTKLDADDLRAETMFMGLRLNAGVSFAHFRERCGVELDTVYGDTLAELVELGLLERDELCVRLTERGRMLGNQVFTRFV